MSAARAHSRRVAAGFAHANSNPSRHAKIYRRIRTTPRRTTPAFLHPPLRLLALPPVPPPQILIEYG